MGHGNAVEVELKYLGADLNDVRRRLRAASANPDPAGRSLETNVVFDTSVGALQRSGQVLRLRNGAELTLKTPVEDERFKSRREHTIHIADGETEGLLGALGFEPAWRYEKYREGWDLDGMWITLDEMPFVGNVVEIEGDRERIDETAKRLGLDGLPTSTGSYRELFDAHLREHGLPESDMTFEAERAATRVG